MTARRQPLSGWPWTLSRRDKRRAFLAGKMLLDEMRHDPECRKAVLEELDAFLTHPRDRDLFGLPLLPSVCPCEDKPGLRVLMHFQGPSFRELLPPAPHIRVRTFNIPGPGRASIPAAVTAMEATLATAPQLKRQTCGRAGSEPQKPALHFALYWGAAAAPDRAAVDDRVTDSLRAVALQEHQAIAIVCAPVTLPHVHVLANRVHPVTGRVADVLTWVALDRWAKSYHRHPDIQPSCQLHPGPPDAA